MANGRPGLPKGRTNNKNGRPKKGETFTDVLNAKYSKADFIDKCWQMFLNGDTTAMKYLGDRWEGTPTQTQIVTGANGDDLFQAFADLADSAVRKKAKLDEPEL